MPAVPQSITIADLVLLGLNVVPAIELIFPEEFFPFKGELTILAL